MALAQIMVSFAVGKFLHKFNIGRHQIVLIGSSFIIAQTVLFAYLEFVESSMMFLVISLVGQTLCGIGSGANMTANMAIIGSFDGGEKERYLGWIQAANGLGLLSGPLVGAVLYNLGGFSLPFIFFGKLLCS